MKAGHNAIYHLPVTLLVIVFCLFAGKAGARGVDSMRISGRVAVWSDVSQRSYPYDYQATYGLFKDKKAAKKAVAAINRIYKTEYSFEQIHTSLKEEGFCNYTEYNGTFDCMAAPGMVVVGMLYYGETLQVREENVIKDGKTDYTFIVNSPAFCQQNVCWHCLKKGWRNSDFDLDYDLDTGNRCTGDIGSIPEDESGVDRYYLTKRPFKFLEFTEDMKISQPEAFEASRMLIDSYGWGCVRDRSYYRFVNLVTNSSLMNEAVLRTECPEMFDGFDFKKANNAIDLLDDNDPRKWYLKGLLWSGKANDEEPDLCAYRFPELKGFRPLTEEDENILAMLGYSAFEKYSKEKDAFLEKHGKLHRDDYNGIRHYLAYFHHSFRLGGPMFRKCYLTEGDVSEEKRKENKYLKKDFAAYDELFKLLKARDDDNRARLLGKEVIDYEKYTVSDGNVLRITGGINVVSVISNGRDTIDCSVSYGLFKDIAEAEKVKKQVDSLQCKTMTSEDFRIACRHLGVNRRTTKSGRFVTLAKPGMVILPVTEDGETVAAITDENVVRKGKTDYMLTIKSFSINGAKSIAGGNRYRY